MMRLRLQLNRLPPLAASWTAVAERSGDTALVSRRAGLGSGGNRFAGGESGVALRLPPQSMTRAVFVMLLSGLFAVATSAFAAAVGELVDDRLAVEKVYYAKQTGQKPPSEVAVTRSVVERRVQQELLKERVLKSVYRLEITPKLVERLLKKYPNAIAGMKDSSGDWNNTKTFLDAFAKSGFDVFVGSESFLLQGLRNGGVGTISATANVNPGAIHKLYTEWKNADADAQQAALNVARDAFGKKYLMIGALKQGIAIYANDPVWATVRPPLVALTAEQAKSLEAELKAINFTMPGLKRPGAAIAA